MKHAAKLRMSLNVISSDFKRSGIIISFNPDAIEYSVYADVVLEQDEQANENSHNEEKSMERAHLSNVS